MGKKSFKELTTFKTGGEIGHFFEVVDKSGLLEVINFCKEKSLPLFMIGGGSDILVNDKVFNGVVVRYVGKNIDVSEKANHVLVTAEAGAVWDDLVAFCVTKKLQGIECLSGIPGTVGAAPIQNIGAYGQELKDTFWELTAYDQKLSKFVTFRKNECDFSYRDSLFRKRKYWQRYIITDVTLKLKHGQSPKVSYAALNNYLNDHGILNPDLNQVRDAVLAVRAGKFENYKEVPNAGSFFKNPIISEKKLSILQKKYTSVPCYKNAEGKYKCFAGWFIEKAGWKGKTYKNAAVSKSHALILTNPKGDAKATDIVELSQKIISDVNKKFGVKLEREVQLINF